jgi:hypothetical protein
MKLPTKAAFFAVALFSCLLIATAVNVNAQCVGCTVAPPGFICTAATAGGDSCQTGDGGSCTMTGACTPINNLNGESKGSCVPKILGHPQVAISDKIVAQVGEQDPRMAIALINVRKIAVEFKVAKVNFAPINYTTEDVVNHITQPHDSPYFASIKKRAADAFAGGGSPVVYDISITEGRSPDTVVLTVRSADSSALHSSIELTLSKAMSGKDKNVAADFQVTGWEFN